MILADFEYLSLGPYVVQRDVGRWASTATHDVLADAIRQWWIEPAAPGVPQMALRDARNITIALMSYESGFWITAEIVDWMRSTGCAPDAVERMEMQVRFMWAERQEVERSWPA